MSDTTDGRVPARLRSLHWTVLGLSFALTIFAWYSTSAQLHRSVTERFEREAQGLVQMIAERMQKYEVGLWAGVGLIEALGTGQDLSAGQWRRFANDIDLPGKYPGVDGIGVIYHAADQAAAPGQRPERLTMTLVEPLEPNRDDVGQDLGFERNAFEAAMRAMSAGAAQISGPLVLRKRSADSPSFLFMAPFFHDRQRPPSLSNLGGLVYQPFTASTLIAGVSAAADRRVTFRLRDGDTLLYAEDERNTPSYDPFPMFQTRISLPLYGREWVFEVQNSENFRHSVAAVQPVTILLVGLTVNSLLVAIFLMLVRSNKRASELATQVTDDLRLSQTELQRRNEELIQFNYRVSHDLVAPLRTVLGLVRMIRDDVAEGDLDEMPQALAKVDELVQNQLGLITNIFNLCKADHGKEEFSLVALAPLVDEVFREQLMTHENARVALRVDLDACPAIIAQPNRLRQVFSNLISNAIKYRDPEREESFVEVSSSVGPGGVVLRVGDNGIGIAQEHQDQVFDLFFRAHSRVADGAGLGTYIVRKHIENMGGRVRLFSDNAGTCFELELPEYQQQGSQA